MPAAGGARHPLCRGGGSGGHLAAAGRKGLHRGAARGAPARADRRAARAPGDPRCPGLPGDPRVRAVPQRGPGAGGRPGGTHQRRAQYAGLARGGSQRAGREALLDGDVGTLWTQGLPTTAHPAAVTLDMGRAVTLGGFSLTPPRHLAADATPPRGYRAQTSLDGQTWQDQGSGEFSNIAYALATQRIGFAAPVQARYLRLTFAEPALAGRTVLAIAGVGGFSGALPR
ncbi:discoidin domain-containing protein [Novosphingobium pokkalii]|uniref:discoidin domain-containing protein n=1 Tax=Novosphingobium pokkalii TaxID=1770194 RepID=UPI0036330F45